MTDKSAREIAARGHCRATCGYAKISGTPCETKCTAPDFNLLHGGHYGAVGAILAALEAGGFAVVPKEPTPEMLTAMHDAWDYFDANSDVFRREYKAAVAAANPKEEGK